MSDRPALKLTSTVLDSPDPAALAEFYHRLLGWPLRHADPTWSTLRPVDAGPGLSVQLEPNYVRPAWPTTGGRQQMMSHLDFEVTDLAAATAHAIAAGAVLAESQPQDNVLVCLDPDGHPFCLWVEP